MVRHVCGRSAPIAWEFFFRASTTAENRTGRSSCRSGRFLPLRHGPRLRIYPSRLWVYPSHLCECFECSRCTVAGASAPGGMSKEEGLAVSIFGILFLLAFGCREIAASCFVPSKRCFLVKRVHTYACSFTCIDGRKKKRYMDEYIRTFTQKILERLSQFTRRKRGFVMQLFPSTGTNNCKQTHTHACARAHTHIRTRIHRRTAPESSEQRHQRLE